MTKKPSGYWTLDRCKADASKYPGRAAWRRASSGAYSAAHANGWLDICCGPSTQQPYNHWTLERCQAAALKYSTRLEWKNSVDSKSFASAHAKKWLDLCCAHMVPKAKPSGYWTLERCQAAGAKFKERSAWAKSKDPEDAGSHNAARKKGWLDLCCPIQLGKPNYWTLERCKEAALKYGRRSDWQRSVDRASYRAASKKKWLEQCCAHMAPKWSA
jgi:hypothetical protein